MPVNAFFHPKTVNDVTSDVPVALRFQIIDKQYATALKGYSAKVKNEKVKVSAYKVEKVPEANAVKIVGEIITGQTDTLVMVEVRDKTLLIWTEATNYVADFEKFVLKSLTFEP